MLPLENIHIVDLTEALAGPYCAMLLGDLGAVEKYGSMGTRDFAISAPRRSKMRARTLCVPLSMARRYSPNIIHSVGHNGCDGMYRIATSPTAGWRSRLSSYHS